MGIDKIKYITALLQNAGISLKKRDEVITNAEQIEKSLSQLELLQYCHGKDIISVTERLLNLDGVETVEAEQLIWATVERSQCKAFPNLQRAVAFLKSVE